MICASALFGIFTVTRFFFFLGVPFVVRPMPPLGPPLCFLRVACGSRVLYLVYCFLDRFCSFFHALTRVFDAYLRPCFDLLEEFGCFGVGKSASRLLQVIVRTCFQGTDEYVITGEEEVCRVNQLFRTLPYGG